MAKSKRGMTINLGGAGMSVLGVILVLGKLLGWGSLATAPWWAVTMPFWIGIAVVLAFFVLFIVVGLACLIGGAGFLGAVEWLEARNRRNLYKGAR